MLDPYHVIFPMLNTILYTILYTIFNSFLYVYQAGVLDLMMIYGFTGQSSAAKMDIYLDFHHGDL